jgi:hypothetical protein
MHISGCVAKGRKISKGMVDIAHGNHISPFNDAINAH